MNNERTTPNSRNIDFVVGVLTFIVIAILICVNLVIVNSAKHTEKQREELRKELHQCWSEKLNG